MNTSESHISARTSPSTHLPTVTAAGTTNDTLRVCPTEAMLDTMARGWCPGLSRPMASGDGLLARVHPPHGCLTPEQALALAEAAHLEGNGLIDITSHANLQIRGVRPSTHAALRARLAPLGLDDEGHRAPYRATVLSPLAGLDGTERVDGRALAERVEAMARDVFLPPKFLIAVDSGGGFSLNHLSPDLRLAAPAPGFLHLVLAGKPALGTAALPVEQALVALPHLLETLATTLAQAGVRRVRMLTGNARRAVLVQAGLMEAARTESPRARQPAGGPPPAPDSRSSFRAVEDATPAGLVSGESPFSGAPRNGEERGSPLPQPKPPRAGTMRLKDGTFALFAAPPFGQMSARALEGVAMLAQDLGLPEIRLSPLRGVVLTGLAPAALAEARTRLGTLGLIIRADDARLRILTCAGAPACARARCNSHALASQLAAHLRPATGTEDIHLSACLKGCARRGPAPLTLVAQPGGFDVIPDGGPLDSPAMVLTFPEILQRLSTLPAGRALREAFVKDHSAR